MILAFIALAAACASLCAQPAPATVAPTTLDCGAVPSSILGRSVNICVALPAGYETATSTRYPALYFLHGLFENERRWSERGGKQVLDDLITQGQVGKFLVVIPDGGRTFYINSFDGHARYEDFFIQELVPTIDKKYRTIPTLSARAISGSSMGGYGALHIGMRHADVFSAASAHSAVLIPKIPNPLPAEGRWQRYASILQGPYGSPLNEGYWEQNSPITLAEHPDRFTGLKLYFDCGNHDRYGFDEGAQLLDKALTAKGFPHEFTLREGDHGWSYLNQYMKYSLLFHWQLFKDLKDGAVASAGKKGGP